MRKKAFFIGISMIFLIFCSIYLMWCKAMLSPDMPVVSVQGGLYDEEVSVDLSTTWGHEIYYTTDGSTPTYQSLKYEGPIRITDRSQDENTYRNIKNVVEDWEEYEAYVPPVEKGTVVKAVSVSKWGNTSEIVTETYFIGRHDLNDEDTYIVSLTADSEELFGEDGIYVTGKEYDDAYLNKSTQVDGELIPNFLKRIEIKGNLEIFEKGERILNQQVGVRVRGNSSRRHALKDFGLFSRKEYSGNDYFEYPLYGNMKTHSVMFKKFSIDAMVSEMLSDRQIATQKSKKAKVFLNGEFWYDTYMLERYDQDYFKRYYGVKDAVIIDNLLIVHAKNHETEGNFRALRDWIIHTDFTDSDNWEILQTRIDMQSYIDYMAANLYLCNMDVDEETNYMAWFSEENEGTFYGDGRWRWALYDMDWMGGSDTNIFLWRLNDREKNPLYWSFKENDAFCRQFVLSFMDMANNNFSPENVEPILKTHGTDLSWKDNFFLKRFDCVTAYLAEEFQLSGTLENAEISINDPEGGSVTVNTSVINLSDGSWSGKYYTDYPITVTAVPNEGYIFDGWEGDIKQTDESITVSVEGGLHLRAVFEKNRKTEDVIG